MVGSRCDPRVKGGAGQSAVRSMTRRLAAAGRFRRQHVFPDRDIDSRYVTCLIRHSLDRGPMRPGDCLIDEPGTREGPSTSLTASLVSSAARRDEGPSARVMITEW